MSRPQKLILFDLLGTWCGMRYFAEAFTEIFPPEDYDVEVCSNYCLSRTGKTQDAGRLPMLFGQKKWVSVLRLLQCLFILWRLLLAHPKALVIFFSYGELTELPFLLTAVCCKRVIVDIHEVYALRFADQSRPARLFLFLARRYRSFVIYHSERSHQTLHIRARRTRPSVYLPHFAYNFPKTCVMEHVGDDVRACFASPKRTRYLFFGNLSHPKGADIAYQVFASLSEAERQNIEFVIAGKNVSGFHFEALSTLSPHYHVICRHILDDELVYLYSHADYILLPYRKSSQSGIMAMAIYFHKYMLCTDIDYFSCMLSKYPSFGKLAPLASYADLVRSTLPSSAATTRPAAYLESDCKAYLQPPALEKLLASLSSLTHSLRLTLCACILAASTTAASAIGGWTIYNATPEVTQVQTHASYLYTVTGQSLCRFASDTATTAYQPLSRTDGLSGTLVDRICHAPSVNKLAVFYSDGNIDILDENHAITSLPDLAEKSLSGDKTIYSVTAADTSLYVAGGFGMFRLDMVRDRIAQSYSTSFAVRYAFALGSQLFRYSDSRGLEHGDPARNLSDAAQWETVAAPALSQIVVSDTQHAYLLDQTGALYRLTSDAQCTGPLFSTTFSSVTVVGSTLFLPAASENRLYLLDDTSQALAYTDDAPYYYATGFAAADTASTFYYIVDNRIFSASFGTLYDGQPIGIDTDWNHARTAEGIATAYPGEIQLQEGGDFLCISRRTYRSGYQAAHDLAGVLTTFSAATSKFKNITLSNIYSSLTYNREFKGVTGVAIDPLHDERYVVSTGTTGLYVFDHDTLFTRLDDTNTNGGIEAFDPTFLSTRTSAVAYDDAGRLYVTCSFTDTLLRCLTPEGRWIKYPHSGMSSVAEARRILLAQHDGLGLKWICSGYPYKQSRVGIYYDAGTPEVTSDDQVAWFSTLVDQNYNNYTPNYITDLVEDNSGKVWVLTNLGPFVVDDPRETFNYAQENAGKGKVRRVIVPRNDGTNLADYLMESTTVSCMVCDNFDRKWIGTDGAGLYLLSADCLTEIEHFTTDNSPLLSDDVLTLAFEAATGKVYIGQQGGIVVYESDAIEGAQDFGGLYAYPNPVRPEYSGEIRIMGLMNQSTVSITTTNGDLIYRTVSDGATTTWDGRNAAGDRVKPGVYLIHGVQADDKKGGVCKLLIL